MFELRAAHKLALIVPQLRKQLYNILAVTDHNFENNKELHAELDKIHQNAQLLELLRSILMLSHEEREQIISLMSPVEAAESESKFYCFCHFDVTV